MIYKEAVEYCENSEDCNDCIVYKQNLDKRTEYERCSLHIPCCENLVSRKGENKMKLVDVDKIIKEIERFQNELRLEAVYASEVDDFELGMAIDRQLNLLSRLKLKINSQPIIDVKNAEK